MTAMAAPVAIVTGAGQGIGRAAALALAGRGRHVVVADRDPATGAETVARVAAAGGSASLAAVDVTDPAAVDAMAAAVLARHGAIDALVTCARWTGLVPTPVAEIADADWRRAMDVNVTGTFNCVRAVVPSMSARRRGRIVILSSATVTLPPARPYVHYLTTKAALIGMTRGLAKELGAVGITVNAVLPGSVETGVPRPHLGADDRAARAAASQSVPVPVRPEDVAAAIVFLVCDETGMITGQSITVDGGRSFL